MAYDEKTALILSLVMGRRLSPVFVRILVNRHFLWPVTAHVSNRYKLANHFFVFLVRVLLLIKRIVFALFLLYVPLFLDLLAARGNRQIEVFGCVRGAPLARTRIENRGRLGANTVFRGVLLLCQGDCATSGFPLLNAGVVGVQDHHGAFLR